MAETPPVSSTIHNLITDTKIGLPAESSMTFLCGLCGNRRVCVDTPVLVFVIDKIPFGVIISDEMSEGKIKYFDVIVACTSELLRA